MFQHLDFPKYFFLSSFWTTCTKIKHTNFLTAGQKSQKNLMKAYGYIYQLTNNEMFHDFTEKSQ